MYSSIALFSAGLALAAATHIAEGPNRRTISFGSGGSAIDTIGPAGVIFDSHAPLLLASTIQNLITPPVFPFLPEASLSYTAPNLVSGKLHGAPSINPPAGVPFIARSFYESAVFPQPFQIPYGRAVVSGQSGVVADHP